MYSNSFFKASAVIHKHKSLVLAPLEGGWKSSEPVEHARAQYVLETNPLLSLYRIHFETEPFGIISEQ